MEFGSSHQYFFIPVTVSSVCVDHDLGQPSLCCPLPSSSRILNSKCPALFRSIHSTFLEPHSFRHKSFRRTTEQFIRKNNCHEVAIVTSQSEKLTDSEAAFKELKSLLKQVPVYFIGMMGSGKSTVALEVAKGLGYKFLDTDKIIEQTTKMSIPDIFTLEGEGSFRKIETQILQAVQVYVRTCIATGGGIVIAKENWGYLRTGVVVWLDAPVDVILERIKGDTNRPLLASPEGEKARLNNLLNDRRLMYEQADVRVPVGAQDSLEDSVQETVRLLSNFIKENPPKSSKLSPNGMTPGNREQEGA